MVLAVLVRTAHEDSQALVAASDKEQSELHAGEGLIRADRQIYQVGLADPDARVWAHVQEIGERAEMPALSGQPEDLVGRALLGQVRLERDLDIGVVERHERLCDHGQTRRLRAEVPVDQRAELRGPLLPPSLGHVLKESLEQRGEVRDVLVHGHGGDAIALRRLPHRIVATTARANSATPATARMR